MMTIDWRFALALIIPDAKYGWLQPAAESVDDILGKYEYIDWRDTRTKPTEQELTDAWNNYVTANGTPQAQEESAVQLAKNAVVDAKQFYIDNPAAANLFELSQADLEGEIDNLDLSALPSGTANKLKLLLKALPTNDRVFSRKQRLL